MEQEKREEQDKFVVVFWLAAHTHTHSREKWGLEAKGGGFKTNKKREKQRKYLFFFLFLLYLLKKKKLINIKHALKRTKKNPNELQLI
jgi:hypothetical protein